MIDKMISALLEIKEKIKETQEIKKKLIEEERKLNKEIQSYLNEQDTQEIEIDEKTQLVLTKYKKRINLNRKDHERRVILMLHEKGIYDDDFARSLLDKTADIIQEQKIKINKQK